MPLQKILREECKVPPNPEKIDEAIQIARTAMKRPDKGRSHSSGYFIYLQVKRAMPALWIVQALPVLALAALWQRFTAARSPVANDPRFVALFIGCFSIYIAMSGVYLMLRSLRYNMNEIEMSTMISARRQLFARLAILGMRDIALFGIVTVAAKAISQMRVATIAGCILIPFLLSNCIGLTVALYTSSDSFHLRIAALGIALGFTLLLAYLFVPGILDLFSSHAGGAICAALFLFCVNRIGRLSARLSSMNPAAEIE